jgi:4-amino-4-deoxy-L-arabinose transferase-like glycosyltransferase
VNQRRTRIALLAISAVGLAARLLFALSRESYPLPGDGRYYYQTGKLIAAGKGLVDPAAGTPTAQHPPVLSSFLALLDLLGISSVEAQRIALAIVSTAAVPLVYLLGRKVAGSVAGLVAAAIAAISPLWFQPGGQLMSESLYLIAISAMLWLALLVVEQPTLWRVIALGSTIGIATMTRSEAIWFIAGAVVLVVVVARWRRALLALALVGAFALVVAPWLIRNEVQMGGLVLSDDIGNTLAGSYCPSALRPPYDGNFDVYCVFSAGSAVLKQKGPWTERTLSNRLQSNTLSYAFDHLSQLPSDFLTREQAMTGIGVVRSQVDYAVAEGRAHIPELLGMILDWLLVPFAVVGAVLIARRKRTTFAILVFPLLVVMVNVALFYGSTRMRVAAEPSVAVLGATGIVRVVELVGKRRTHTDDRFLQTSVASDHHSPATV